MRIQPVLILSAVLIIMLCGFTCRSNSDKENHSAAPFESSGPAVGLIDSSGKEHPVTVELARAPEELARGLMYRQSLPADSGMLFILPTEKIQHFWMKNTYIPLDMIFINSHLTIVGIVENAEPLTTTARSVSRPSRYVLEVNGGYSARIGIKTGCKVKLYNIKEK